MTSLRPHIPSGPFVTDPCAICGLSGLACEKLENQICPGPASPQQASGDDSERIWQITKDLSAYTLEEHHGARTRD